MRGLIAIGSGIAGVAVLAVAVLAVAGSREPTAYPPDSPEAALQAYLLAFEAGDYPAAYEFFSPSVQRAMSYQTYQQAARDYTSYASGSRRVLYEGTDGIGETVSLRLTIEVSSTGGLTTDRYRYPTTVPMVRTADGWRIDQLLVHLDPAPVEYRKPGPD